MGRRSHLVSLFDAPGVVWAAGIRHGLRQVFKSLYGILLVMIYTFVLDKVLVIGTHQARADIVSSHYEEIRQAIFTRLDRGCTLLNATTGYLQTDQPVLMTVVSRREMASLNQIVMEIDPHAFLIISDANEVKGSGFTSTKIHKKNPNL